MTDVVSHQILTSPRLPTFSRKRRYLLWLLHGCSMAAALLNASRNSS
jgi:hypothetical protein